MLLLFIRSMLPLLLLWCRRWYRCHGKKSYSDGAEALARGPCAPGDGKGNGQAYSRHGYPQASILFYYFSVFTCFKPSSLLVHLLFSFLQIFYWGTFNFPFLKPAAQFKRIQSTLPTCSTFSSSTCNGRAKKRDRPTGVSIGCTMVYFSGKFAFLFSSKNCP